MTDGPAHRHGERVHAHDHDDPGHEHLHDDLAHGPLDAAHIWALDNIVLTTVGIDVGSSTSHFMFGRVHLRREGESGATRFVVVDRSVVWSSPVLLTPYRGDDTIAADEVAAFVAAGYRSAGLAPGDVDAGAVILTGEALKRHNARALADSLASEAGTFVCASAGHHMEALLAAHGSGAVQRSAATGRTFLNVDMGGGTTKLALVAGGTVIATAAVAVGARSIVTDDRGRIVRLEQPAVELARDLGAALARGEALPPNLRGRIVARMIDVVLQLIRGGPLDALVRRLLVTEPLDAAHGVDAVIVSGGVAEYFYGREPASFGDLGADLAQRLRAELAAGGIAVGEAGQGIRATAIGASQFTVQVSGNTIHVSSPEQLPLRNVPVVACRFALDGAVVAGEVAATIRAALVRAPLADPAQPVALAFAWRGEPSFARLDPLARGIAAALRPQLAAGAPLVLAIDGDVALTLGRLLRAEIVPGAEVVAVDALQLQELDYIDVGAVREPANVVPVTVKSLLF